MVQLNSCAMCEHKNPALAEVCASCGYPNKRPKESLWSKGKVIVTTLLAIIGLSGIADGIVEWREFFEVGFMEHYRAFKITIMSWIPFDVWWWIPDYLVLGSIAYAALIYSIRNIALQADFEFQASDIKIKIYILIYVLCLILWPFGMVIYYFLFLYISRHLINEFEKSYEKIAKKNDIKYKNEHEKELLIKSGKAAIDYTLADIQKLILKFYKLITFNYMKIFGISIIFVFLVFDFHKTFVL